MEGVVRHQHRDERALRPDARGAARAIRQGGRGDPVAGARGAGGLGQGADRNDPLLLRPASPSSSGRGRSRPGLPGRRGRGLRRAVRRRMGALARRGIGRAPAAARGLAGAPGARGPRRRFRRAGRSRRGRFSRRCPRSPRGFCPRPMPRRPAILRWTPRSLPSRARRSGRRRGRKTPPRRLFTRARRASRRARARAARPR